MPEENINEELINQSGVDDVLRSEIEELKRVNAELISKNEELSSRIETLQDSLDTALEEISLREKEPVADILDEEKIDLEKEEIVKNKEKQRYDTNAIEEEIEKTIKEEERFRMEQLSTLEEILVKQEARDLEDEIAKALSDFPKASREEILSEIESMTDDEAANVDIRELAQLSHERQLIEEEKLKEKIEGELRTQLQKEMEGKISIPQSSGSPSAPIRSAQINASPASPFSSDAEWDEALRRAKVEG